VGAPCFSRGSWTSVQRKSDSFRKDGLEGLRENSALSPVGTSESSPGRSPGLGMRHRAVPQGRLKTRLLRSAVPRGTVYLVYRYPCLRPGLLSARPCGTQLGERGSHADSLALDFRGQPGEMPTLIIVASPASVMKHDGDYIQDSLRQGIRLC
jgi:hypothetical protein